MHMKYLVDITCTFPLAAILLKIANGSSVSIVKLRGSISHSVMDPIGATYSQEIIEMVYIEKNYKCF